MTRKEVLLAIEECEKNGKFDEHVDPIPKELTIPVTEDYHYPNKRTAKEKIKYFFEKIFIVKPFTVYQNKCCLKTRVFGRKNLKGLKAAVLTCNHVAKFDCLAVKHGAKGHKTYVVAAPFNNMKGFLGEMMRAGDMLPMNTTMHGTVAFNKMVEEVIKVKKSFLLIYPEASMWWHYEKPRPYKDGAFYIAAKYGVPVVPQFITYRDSGKKDGEGIPIYYFDLHICEPVYPKEEFSKSENIEYLKNSAFEACKNIYENVYGKKLSYAK